MSADAVPLYLMAKAPVAGAVKTRIAAHIGGARAAELAATMLSQTAATARRHWPGAVVLCASPDADHPVFRRLADEHHLAVTTQVNADLGARMSAALNDGVAVAGAAAVVGCDVPHCRGEIFARAHDLLVGGDNPVGPATDGGFYLLGVTAAADALFAGVDWRAPALQQVRDRAAAAGVTLSELPALRDIDRYADLQHLAGIDDRYANFL